MWRSSWIVGSSCGYTLRSCPFARECKSEFPKDRLWFHQNIIIHIARKCGFRPRLSFWNCQIFINVDNTHLKWKLSSRGIRICFYFWNTTADGWNIAINFYPAGFWGLLRRAALNSNEWTWEALLRILHSQDANLSVGKRSALYLL